MADRRGFLVNGLVGKPFGLLFESLKKHHDGDDK